MATTNELQQTLENILNDKNTNLKPRNLKKGVTALGVQGALDYIDTADATATVGDILSGKTAYVYDEKLEGTMPNNGELEYTPTTSQQTIPAGYTSGGTISAVTSSIDANIIAENIKEGVTILGVTGNVEPDKPDQTKTVTPTTSNQVIEPDTGYELASVTVNGVTSAIDNNIVAGNIKSGATILGVTGSVVELNGETKNITPTTSQQTITPTAPKNGFTQVTVDGVTSSIDANIVAGNIKKDVTILGVTGTYEGSGGGGTGDVKLFETVQEMNEDPSPTLGDLAVVYGDNIQNWEENTQASKITFPSSVTLSEAYSDWADISMRAVDSSHYFNGYVSLSSGGFSFYGHGENININVSYNSSDGIHYTRTDGGAETIDIGFDIYCQYDWDDAAGNFMQVGGKSFDGFFKYSTINDTEVIPIYSFSADTTTSTGTITYVDEISVSIFNEFVEAINEYTGSSYKEMNLFMPSAKNKIVAYGYVTTSNNQLWTMSEYVTKYNGSWYLTGFSSKIDTAKRYEYDIQSKSITATDWVTDISFPVHSSAQQAQMRLQEEYILPSVRIDLGVPYELNYIYIGYSEDTSKPLHISPNFNTSNTFSYPEKNRYVYAPSQLTLAGANQILPDVIGYGKNGVVTGDGTIFTNMNGQDLLEPIFGLTPEIAESTNTNYNSYTIYNGTTTKHSLLESEKIGKLTYLKDNPFTTFSKKYVGNIINSNYNKGVTILSGRTLYRSYYNKKHDLMISFQYLTDWNTDCKLVVEDNSTHTILNQQDFAQTGYHTICCCDDYIYFGRMLNGTLTLRKMNLTTYEITTADTVSSGSSSSNFILTTNGTNLIYIVNGGTSSSSSSKIYVKIIDDATGTITVLRNGDTASSGYNTLPRVIRYDNENIYVVTKIGFYQDHYKTKLQKYNISTKAVTTYWEKTGSIVISSNDTSTDILGGVFEDDTYVYMSSRIFLKASPETYDFKVYITDDNGDPIPQYRQGEGQSSSYDSPEFISIDGKMGVLIQGVLVKFKSYTVTIDGSHANLTGVLDKAFPMYKQRRIFVYDEVKDVNVGYDVKPILKTFTYSDNNYLVEVAQEQRNCFANVKFVSCVDGTASDYDYAQVQTPEDALITYASLGSADITPVEIEEAVEQALDLFDDSEEEEE